MGGRATARYGRTESDFKEENKGTFELLMTSPDSFPIRRRVEAQVRREYSSEWFGGICVAAELAERWRSKEAVKFQAVSGWPSRRCYVFAYIVDHP